MAYMNEGDNTTVSKYVCIEFHKHDVGHWLLERKLSDEEAKGDLDVMTGWVEGKDFWDKGRFFLFF